MRNFDLAYRNLIRLPAFDGFSLLFYSVCGFLLNSWGKEGGTEFEKNVGLLEEWKRKKGPEWIRFVNGIT